MSIQGGNNYFQSLSDEVIDNIVSFLPKKDGMKLGLTSKRLYLAVKNALFFNLTKEQVYLKRDIASLYDMRLFDSEYRSNLNQEQLLVNMKLTFEKVDAKIKDYFQNNEILRSLTIDNGGPPINAMFEMQSLMSLFLEYKKLETRIKWEVYWGQI